MCRMSLNRYVNPSNLADANSSNSSSCNRGCDSESAQALRDIVGLLDDLNNRDLCLLDDIIKRLLCSRDLA